MSLANTAVSLRKGQQTILDRTKAKGLHTPALLVDLDVMERNLCKMAAFFGDRPVKLRPHFKTHQVISLAWKQVRAGAVGITCARLEHAETLVQQGIKSVLMAREIAGDSLIRSFVDLSRRAPVMLVVDNPKVIADMARLAGDHRHELNIVVDLDLGLNRCGVLPGEGVLSLTRLILEKGLKFRGVMGYQGNLRLPPGPEKQRLAEAATGLLASTRRLIEGEGIPVEIVSCGGTGDYSTVGAISGVTEIQAGSYLLMDTWYVPFAPDFEPALSVLGTVISKTSGERLVMNVGVKALSSERGLPPIKGNQRLRIRALHAEHALIEVADPSVSVEAGDQIEIWVHHLDATVSLHDRMYGVRDGEVKEVFKIER